MPATSAPQVTFQGRLYRRDRPAARTGVKTSPSGCSLHLLVAPLSTARADAAGLVHNGFFDTVVGRVFQVQALPRRFCPGRSTWRLLSAVEHGRRGSGSMARLMRSPSCPARLSRKRGHPVPVRPSGCQPSSPCATMPQGIPPVPGPAGSPPDGRAWPAARRRCWARERWQRGHHLSNPGDFLAAT